MTQQEIEVLEAARYWILADSNEKSAALAEALDEIIRKYSTVATNP